MAKKTAEIEVKVTGAEQSATKIKELAEGVEKLGGKLQAAKKPATDAAAALGEGPKQASIAWQRFGGIVANATAGFVRDVARLSNVASNITFAGSVENARAYQATLGRLSAYTNTSAESMKKSFDEIGSAKIMSREQTTGMFVALQRLSGDADYATKSMGRLHDEAVATGRSDSEMAGLGATLHSVYGVTGDVGKALGVVRAQAEEMGTVGGAATLYDQMESLAGIMGTVSTESDESRNKITGMLAQFQGGSKDLSKGARVFAGMAQSIESQPAMVASFLGKSVKSLYTDPKTGELTGKMNLATIIPQIQKQFFKAHGRSDRSFEIAVNTWGPEVAAALFKQDTKKGPQATVPKVSAEKIAEKNYKSEAAQHEKAKIEAENKAADLAEKAIPTLNAFDKFAGNHPVLANVGQKAVDLGSTYLSLKAVGAVAGGISKAGGIGTAVKGVATGMGGATVGAGLLAAGSVALAAYRIHKTTQELGGGAAVGRDLVDWFSGKSGSGVASDKVKENSPLWKKARAAAGAGLPMGTFGPEAPKGMAAVASAAGESRALATALAQAMKQSPLSITIINQTGGPVQAVADRQAPKQ